MAIKRVYPKRKVKMLQEFTSLIKQNRYLIVINAYKCKAIILNEARAVQEDLKFIIKGGKNNLLRLAVQKVYPQTREILNNVLTGQNVFVFTNEDPFKIAFKLGELEVRTSASPGDIATEDILIKEGNTGLSPGPIISLFSACKVPTKIVSGSVHVARDVIVAKKGERISANLANLLGKLGIKPIKAKVKFRAAIDLKEGIIIHEDLLRPEIVQKYEKEIKNAALNALKVSIEISYPTPENVQILVMRAVIQALGLVERIEYLSIETIPLLVSKAARCAKVVSEIASLAE